MPSPNLDIVHVAASQNQKEVTINDAVDALDRAVTELLTKDLTAETSPLVLTTAEALRAATLRFTGAPAGPFTIQVPANRKGWHVLNDTAVVVTITTAAGSGVDIAAGGRAVLYCDGTDVVLVADSAAASAAPYDIGGSVGGQPDAGETILRYPFPRAVSFPAGMPGSRGVVGTTPAATAVFDLRHNAVSFGTMTFAAAATATFSVPADTVFVPGDVLTVVAPAPQDGTLADLGFSFAGTRS